MGLFRELRDMVRMMRGASARRSSFTCGDCRRVDRCGLPPNPKCIERLAQIAEGLPVRNAAQRLYGHDPRRGVRLRGFMPYF
jgi:hypothetical protein